MECITFDEYSPKLWNRNINQQDFLAHRLGIGKMPFQVPINVPKEKFKLWDDSLNEKPRMIYENYKTLYGLSQIYLRLSQFESYEQASVQILLLFLLYLT